MKIFQNISRYQGGNAVAWISTIAKNLAINEYNKKKKAPLYLNNDIEDYVNPKEYKDSPTIQLAMNILSEDEFLILILSVVQNYTRKSLAEMFNLSTSGVTYKLNQALTKLKEALKNE